jgi:uncharacterized repeat protein (TIGR02543 family)
MNCRAQLLAIVLVSLTACTDPSGAEPEPTSEVSESLGTGSYRLVIPPAFGGTFSVQPAGTLCSANCWTYPAGTVVTVSPTANPDGVFNNWTGDCTGWLTCSVTMNADHTVTGVFIPLFNLSFPPIVNGSVQWDANIGPTKGGGAWAMRSGTIITLTPIPDPGATFTGWTGDCSGTGPCSLPMTQNHTVGATFSAPAGNPTLSILTTGSGVVTANPAPSCVGTLCTYPLGTTVTLTASPATGASFMGWSGDCSGVASTCTVVMTASRSVTASFATSTFPLTVINTGGGSVTSLPAGISCGTLCTVPFSSGTTVTLTAVAATNYTFAGWTGGACMGTGPCTLTMTQARSITAVFQQNSYALHLSPTLNGVIGVMAGAVGTSCGPGCVSYPAGTTVWLYANPNQGATFSGWQGDCAPVGTATTCTLVMNQAHLAGALFGTAAATHTLTVTNSYGGTTQGPTALCGNNATCTWTFAAGESITLTFSPMHASPKTWYTLVGVTGCAWDGGYSCTLTLDDDQQVFVDWEFNTYF